MVWWDVGGDVARVGMRKVGRVMCLRQHREHVSSKIDNVKHSKEVRAKILQTRMKSGQWHSIHKFSRYFKIGNKTPERVKAPMIQRPELLAEPAYQNKKVSRAGPHYPMLIFISPSLVSTMPCSPNFFPGAADPLPVRDEPACCELWDVSLLAPCVSDSFFLSGGWPQTLFESRCEGDCVSTGLFCVLIPGETALRFTVAMSKSSSRRRLNLLRCISSVMAEVAVLLLLLIVGPKASEASEADDCARPRILME